MISWLPYHRYGIAGSRLTSIYSASQAHPVILSAQQGSTCEITLPWVYPKQYMAIDSAASSECGTVQVRVMHPLDSVGSSAPANLTISVFAQFVEPEVFGFAPDVVANMSVRNYIKMQPQSKIHSGKRTAHAETTEKSKSGVITGILEGAMTVAPVLGMAVPEAMPFVETGMQIATALMPFLKSMGLGMPTSVETFQQVVQTPHNRLHHTSGLFQGPKFSLSPDHNIAVAPGLCGDSNPQPYILDVMKTPSLLKYGSFASTTSQYATLASWICHPSLCPQLGDSAGVRYYNPTFLAYYSMMAKYWRGSIKYMVRFTSAKFLTARVRIAHLLEPLSSAIEDVAGDLVSIVVDVSGDTTVQFTVPYIHEEVYLPCLAPNAADTVTGIPFINMYLENPVVSPDTSANPVIYYSVWVAAGDDFRLMCPERIMASANYVWTHPFSRYLRLNAQCDILTEFSKPFPGIVPARYTLETGVVTGEDFGRVTDMAKRFASRSSLPTANTQSYVGPSFRGTTAFDTYRIWIAPFQFIRGGTRVMEKSAGSIAIRGTSNNAISHEENGHVTIASTSANHMQVELPWYDSRIFLEVFPNQDATVVPNFYTNVVASVLFQYAAADDVSVGCLAPPPMLTWTIASPKRSILEIESQPSVAVVDDEYVSKGSSLTPTD